MNELTLSEKIRVAVAVNGELRLSRDEAIALLRMVETAENSVERAERLLIDFFDLKARQDRANRRSLVGSVFLIILIAGMGVLW